MDQILVLRPEPGASATADKARKRGLKVVAVPLFEIEPVAWDVPETSAFDGLLLTSANAVRCGGDTLQPMRGLRVYAVGETTAEAAREAGFEIAGTGNAGIDHLLGSIEPDLKLLHLCGVERYEPAGASQDLTQVAVYRATPIEAPDLGGARGSVALIHSPRAGRRFAELVGERGTIAIAAISEAAAAAVGSGWRIVETAARPTDDALLALASRLCNKPDPK